MRYVSQAVPTWRSPVTNWDRWQSQHDALVEEALAELLADEGYEPQSPDALQIPPAASPHAEFAESGPGRAASGSARIRGDVSGRRARGRADPTGPSGCC